jgi:hypothetical protein
MFLKQKFNYFYPSQFANDSGANATDSAILGTTQKWAIDRTWPIEEIVVTVDFKVAGTALTLKASPTTPDQDDNILTILQHVNLSVNDGKQPRSVVDCNGIALLEYATLTGMNLDQGTLLMAALSQGTTLATGSYSINYRIPIVEPWIAEPLRSRMYLPVHTYPQDPVLSLTFQLGSNMYSAGNIRNVAASVLLIRRQPTAESEALLQKTAGTNPNGYIDFDLIETPFSVAPGVGTEQRFALPIPGQYANLMFRHYLGGSTITRAEIDNSSAVANLGTENRWRIESGLVVEREWRWKHLRTLTEYSRPLNALVPSSGTLTYGVFGGGFVSGTNYRPAASVALNFLHDGLSGDNCTELGSLLDCNAPANSGLKMEIIGTPAVVSTNASYLYVMGRRYFGDLSRWQKFA